MFCLPTPSAIGCGVFPSCVFRLSRPHNSTLEGTTKQTKLLRYTILLCNTLYSLKDLTRVIGGKEEGGGGGGKREPGFVFP